MAALRLLLVGGVCGFLLGVALMLWLDGLLWRRG